MPPKVKITKDAILKSAFNLTRKYGLDYVTAKSIAKDLHCSTQPIYWVFENMENLRKEIVVEANNLYNIYFHKNIKMGANLAKNKHYADLIASLGLCGKEQKFPFELSGGEQQRVSIASNIDMLCQRKSRYMQVIGMRLKERCYIPYPYIQRLS